MGTANSVSSGVKLQTLRSLTDAFTFRTLDYLRLSSEQIRFLSAPDPFVLWRGGNQLGKTIGTGRFPKPPTEPPDRIRRDVTYRMHRSSSNHE
ncbi:MAG: hypothetical protein AAGA48_28390 [Myxococcota bacterium]